MVLARDVLVDIAGTCSVFHVKALAQACHECSFMARLCCGDWTPQVW
jgi:hypothetical protein